MGSTPPIRNPFLNLSSISRGQTESCPTDHGPAVPDSGSGSCGISFPSTHPIVSSLHGRTMSGLTGCLSWIGLEGGVSRPPQAGCRTPRAAVRDVLSVFGRYSVHLGRLERPVRGGRSGPKTSWGAPRRCSAIPLLSTCRVAPRLPSFVPNVEPGEGAVA